MIMTGQQLECYQFMYVSVCIRGEPGIDWNVDNPSQSDITKVYYNVFDANATTSSSKCYYCPYLMYHSYTFCDQKISLLLDLLKIK